MKKTKLIGILICLSLLFAFPLTSSLDNKKIEKRYQDENSLKISLDFPPVWNVGDYWVYDLEVNTSIEDWFPVSLQGSIEDLNFSVGDASYNSYTLNLEGKLKGRFDAILHIKPIPFNLRVLGWLRRTSIDGSIFLTKEGWGLKEIYLHLHGKARLLSLPLPIFAPIPFDATLKIIFNSPCFLFGFSKMEVGEYWIIPTPKFSLYATISLFFGIIGKPFSSEDLSPPNWVDVYTECVAKENVTVPSGTYEAYKIWAEEGGIVEYYYAPQVNNIIKLKTNEELDYFHLNVELKSTSYG